ncbi:glutathione S-transferase family protein [Streptomyces sp. HNM0574]|nr:glutathione S-transferase family protein [Streptomyces sp. HNM0574]
MFRGRIGSRPGSGFHAAPHRYRLYLAPPGPASVRIAVTHRLLGLDAVLPVTLLPPAAPDAGHPVLRGLYEATRHRCEGPFAAPVLGDGWSGRIVSNHAPDIVRDLAGCFGTGTGPELFPAALTRDIARFEALLEECGDEGLREAERRLAGRGHLLGETLTAADVHLWSRLPAPGERPVLDAYRQRLARTHPAFRGDAPRRTPPRPQNEGPAGRPGTPVR